MATSEPEDETTAFWEGHYLARPQVWSGRANPVLVEEVAGLGPGAALDLGCGEGGDALWLAQHGWDVTAVDVAETALQRGAAAAVAAGLADRITWERHDLARSSPTGSYDLVSAQFLQSPIELPRDQVLRRAADAVAPGGSLLVVSHAAYPPWASGHDRRVALPTAAKVLAGLERAEDQWSVQRCEEADREAEGPDGQTGTLIDSVVLVRRSPR